MGIYVHLFILILVSSMILFACDVMLGKLARWLRILGYDTLYEPDRPVKDLFDVINDEERIFLTCRKKDLDDFPLENILQIKSRYFNEQLIQVVIHFKLTFRSRIFTRCINCNTPVKNVNKKEIIHQLPLLVKEFYEIFYICPGCKKVYWDGTHYKNSVNKLRNIFSSEEFDSLFPDH